MSQLLRQNTDTAVLVGPVVDATTGLAKTDASLTVRLLRQDNSGLTAPVVLFDNGEHVADGMYRVMLSAAETNVSTGRVDVWASATGCSPVTPVRFQCVSAPVYDAATASTALTGSALADAVWSSGNRTLSNAPANFAALSITTNGRVTVGTNTDKSGYNVTSVGTGAIDSGSFTSDAIDASALSSSAASEVANSLLDQPNGVEVGLTLRQAIRFISAALFGKVSGAEGTTVVFRNAVADDTNRITATVDSNGNRIAVTTDPS